MPNEIAILSGTAHPELAQKIAHHANAHLYTVKVNRFSNGEVNVDIMESVREKDVFIVQPTATDPNDTIMELLILADAVRRASPGRITAVISSMGYSRQDKKESARAPISAKLIANMLEVSGVDRVLTVDLHTAQLQGFFNIPVDNLYTDHHLLYYAEHNYKHDSLVAVAPGVSAVLRAKRIADLMDIPLAIMHFGKLLPGSPKEEVVVTIADMKLVGDVKGKVAVLISDLVDTCYIETMMAEALIQQGATKVFMMATHGILSDNAIERITKSPLTELVITNTVSCAQKQRDCPKLKVIDIAPLLSDAIRRIHFGDSVSCLFEKSVFTLSMVKPPPVK